MRGRLIFPLLAEIARLDAAAMARLDLYDADFREPVLRDLDSDGVSERVRLETLPVLVPVQVEPEAFEALRMTPSGNAPDTQIQLITHLRDLERLDLVDAGTGRCRLAAGDRLLSLRDRTGRPVETFRARPGVFLTEARPMSFGLGRTPRANLLRLSFEDRAVSRGVA
jgi:hypothetical protein